MKVRDVVEYLIQKSGVPPLKETCDTLKTGSMENEVHGIAVTFMATVEVIQKAIAAGVDLIITHEPIFYEHTDHPKWIEKSSLYMEKLELINSHGISIWRYHDYMHYSKPDMIFEGLLEKLDWKDKIIDVNVDNMIFPPMIAELGGIPLKELISHVKKALNMQNIRIVGNPDTICNRVGITVGAGSLDFNCDLGQVIEEHNLNVLICGDIVEWGILPYVRDAAQLGFNRAMLIVGHNLTEEAGMQLLTSTLHELTCDIPIMGIESGEPYIYC
jgi:putative NIF3 family GTP cyclohydrolase 1 type 2